MANRGIRDSFIASVIRKVGLGAIAQKAYFTTQFFASDGTLSVDVDGIEGVFRVESPYEYQRVSGLLGERRVIEGILSRMDGDSVVYDLGAHVGIHAVFFAKAGARTICFEPNPRNQEALTDHGDLNGVRFDIHGVALSDESGEFVLREQEYAVGVGGILSGSGDGILVDVVRCDDYVQEQNLDQPDIVKIDIEGAELKALRGMRTTLESAKSVFVEVHPKMMDEPAQTVEEELKDQGFNITSRFGMYETTQLVADR